MAYNVTMEVEVDEVSDALDIAQSYTGQLKYFEIDELPEVDEEEDEDEDEDDEDEYTDVDEVDVEDEDEEHEDNCDCDDCKPEA